MLAVPIVLYSLGVIKWRRDALRENTPSSVSCIYLPSHQERSLIRRKRIGQSRSRHIASCASVNGIMVSRDSLQEQAMRARLAPTIARDVTGPR